MTARTHDIIAFASLLTVAAYYPPESLTVTTLMVAMIANNIGALIPDMDSSANKLWDLLPAGDFLGKVFRRIFWKHRTLSHSLLGGWLIYLFLSWLLPMFLSPQLVDVKVVLWSTMIGFVSHLLSDAMTKEGLPLLFPFKGTFGIPPWAKLRMTTGTWVENLVVFPGTVGYILWFAFSHQTEIKALLQLS